MVTGTPAGRQPEDYQASEAFNQEFMAKRTGEYAAGFLLPYLRPGLRLLDCGCGAGSITLDFAAAVAPGEVVGIDIREGDLDKGRSAAQERGIGNVEFRAASIYELPFPDASFDVAFSHAVLQHLGDPLAALKEMRRVLKPGGVVGIADPAWDRSYRMPTNPLLDAWAALIPKVIAHNGGSPLYASSQRALLRQAGFSRTKGIGRLSAGTENIQGIAGTLEETQLSARTHTMLLREFVGKVALAQGWMDQETLDRTAEALEQWGNDPDAIFAGIHLCAIGWV